MSSLSLVCTLNNYVGRKKLVLTIFTTLRNMRQNLYNIAVINLVSALIASKFFSLKLTKTRQEIACLKTVHKTSSRSAKHGSHAIQIPIITALCLVHCFTFLRQQISTQVAIRQHLQSSRLRYLQVSLPRVVNSNASPYPRPLLCLYLFQKRVSSWALRQFVCCYCPFLPYPL